MPGREDILWAEPPQDGPDQAYVSVSILPTGFFHLAHADMFADSLESKETSRVPSLSFLVNHRTSGRKVMFDLGFRKTLETYPERFQKELPDWRVEIENDALDILESGGISADDVEQVILSHFHLDHVGDVSRFPSSQIVIGPGAGEWIRDGYPVPAGRTVREIAFPPNSPFASFERSLDLFGDGSFYLLDAPGHSSEHICAAARVGPGGAFVLLAADCCHARVCYRTERAVSPWNHEDVEVARQTIQRVKMCAQNGFCVVLAHETERVHELPMFPQAIDSWVVGQRAQGGIL